MVDFSILYRACFFEVFSLSPNFLGLGTGHPGNFTQNLRLVSEYTFLLLIYMYCEYTHVHTMRIPI